MPAVNCNFGVNKIATARGPGNMIEFIIALLRPCLFFYYNNIDMIVKESIVICSSMEKVWKTFTDLDCWTEWNTIMKNVGSDKKVLDEGTNLKCIFRPFLFPIEMKIRVESVIPYNRIVWSAKKKGLSAYHEFFFRQQAEGILVTSRETFTGLLTKGSGILLPIRKMQSFTKIFLQDLKKVSES
jgi:hypothetical protein